MDQKNQTYVLARPTEVTITRLREVFHWNYQCIPSTQNGTTEDSFGSFGLHRFHLDYPRSHSGSFQVDPTIEGSG